MKKHAMVKRILSAFLAIVLVVGMITVSESKDVSAGNSREITIDLHENTNSSQVWFATSEDIANYYGDWSTGVAEILVNKVATEKYFSIVHGLMYVEGLDSATELEIPENTEFTIFANGENKTDKTPFKVTSGIKLKKEGTIWKYDVGVAAREITIDLHENTNSSQVWFATSEDIANYYGDWSTGVAEILVNNVATEKYFSIVHGLMYVEGLDSATELEIPENTQFTIFANGENKTDKTPFKVTSGIKLKKEGTTWKYDVGVAARGITLDLHENTNSSQVWFATSEDIANYYGDWSTGVAEILVNKVATEKYFSIVHGLMYVEGLDSATELEIPENTQFTIFANGENKTDKTPFKVTSGVKLKKEGTIWKYDVGVAARGITLDLHENTNSSQVWFATSEDIANYYGDWSTGVAEILVNKVATEKYFSIVHGLMYVEGLDSATELEIPENTEFTIFANGENKTDKTPFKVTSGVKLKKEGTTWKYDVGATARGITLDLHENTNSSQVWFATSEDIANYYGDWSTGVAEILVNKVATEKYFSIVHGLMYVEGLDSATELEIPENTEFTIFANGENKTDKTPFKVTSGVKLKKEGTTWRVAGSEEPTPVVTDIQVTAYELWPNQSADYCQVVVKTDVDLQALYPDQALTGEIKIGDAAKSVTWYIGTNLIYTVGITYDEFMTAESMTIETDSVFELITDPTKKVKFAKGLELINKNGTWISSDVNVVSVPISDYELWRKGEFYQLVIKSTTDLRPVTNQPISGYVYIDGNKKQVEWYVDESTGAVYTVGITLEEGDSAKRIQIPKESLFTILNDSANVLEITKGLKLVQIDGIWMLDEGQTKIDYNEVKVSFSSSDGRGFYLNAEIISGPDKGKDIGGADVYGNWLTTATGAMSYNGDSTVDVFWSPTEKMIYISGDYDPTTMKSIQLKKGTVLRPEAGALCSTMMRLANDLNLAFDTRYNRWVLAGDENKQYTFNEVKVEVARVTGAALELQGTFVNMSSKKLMDVYGDWVNLIGEVILGHPNKGTYTNNGVAYSLAGTSLIIYGIQPGIMDTIEIKAGTILWPDSSCKSTDPIRIANDILLVRDTEDEWVIKAGKMTTKKNNSQSTNETVQSEQKDVVQETLASYDDGPTKVRLVDKDGKNVQDGKQPVVSGNVWGYIGIAFVGALAVALITGLILFLKKRKKDENQTVE